MSTVRYIERIAHAGLRATKRALNAGHRRELAERLGYAE